MPEEFTEQQAADGLEQGYEEAGELLKDQDKIERFLQRLERKLNSIPLVGDKLSYAPVMASLLRCYVKKEYTDIPLGSIIAITSALLYFVSPIDIIPDSVPVIGYLDDAAVLVACWRLVGSDVEEYINWRKKSGLEIDF